MLFIPEQSLYDVKTSTICVSNNRFTLALMISNSTLSTQVTVRDDGRPLLSSTTRVVIEVADVNDHGPVFEQKFYTVQIPASPATDKPLFQV